MRGHRVLSCARRTTTATRPGKRRHGEQSSGTGIHAARKREHVNAISPCDVDFAVLRHSHVIWTKLFRVWAPLADELAVWCEGLHSTVRFVAHDEISTAIKARAQRLVQLAWPVAVSAELTQELAFSAEDLPQQILRTNQQTTTKQTTTHRSTDKRNGARMLRT